VQRSIDRYTASASSKWLFRPWLVSALHFNLKGKLLAGVVIRLGPIAVTSRSKTKVFQ